MPARTIAFLSPLYFHDDSCIGGGERYPLNLARAVIRGASNAWRVELLSFGRTAGIRPIDQNISLRILPAAGIPRDPLDVVSWDMPEAIAGCDLLHIHQPFTRCGELGMLLARQQGKPVCATDHGGVSSRLGEEVGLLELADRVVAYSDFGASLLRTETPIETIKGGVDCSYFRPAEPAPARDRVLYVGRLLPHKGIDRLLQAIPPELPLTICGRAYHADYQGRLLRLAEGKTVEFITDADDAGIRDLYRRAWATILPSVYLDCYGITHRAPELMGLTLLESMACGTPAVASKVGGMPEFIREGRTGFVFEDLDDLTAALVRLATEPGLAERMGRAARDDVLDRFSLATVGARLRELYASLMRGGAEAEAAA